jgi:hypothetical protein
VHLFGAGSRWEPFPTIFTQQNLVPITNAKDGIGMAIMVGVKALLAIGDLSSVHDRPKRYCEKGQTTCQAVCGSPFY